VKLSTFETWGIKTIEKFYEKHDRSTVRYVSLKALFASKILNYFTVISFLIGFFLTIPIIYMEINWQVFEFDTVSASDLFWYVIWLTVLVFLEFYLLFMSGFYILSYYIYHIYHIYNDEVGYIKEEAFLAMLGRTVMELPEKNIVKFNINHKEHSDTDRLIWAMLYKVKVVLTNVVLKFTMKKILTRTSFRIYSPYIAALGTGAWDAFVFYKTAKESHYKITVRFVILYLLKHKIDFLLRDEHIKLILARYLYYGEYNNNFDFLLTKLYTHKTFSYNKEDYLNISIVKSSNKKFLLLIYAFKEKMHGKIEKNIYKDINNENQIKVLKKAFQSGDLDYLYKYIDELEI